MAVFAKVVSLNEVFRFSELTVGGLYEALDPGEIGREFDYDFALIDDVGDKMPFKWDGDIEAEFERVEM